MNTNALILFKHSASYDGVSQIPGKEYSQFDFEFTHLRLGMFVLSCRRTC